MVTHDVRYRCTHKLLFRLTVLSVLLSATAGRGAENPFDLAGPRIEMKVNRSGKSLPISEVPNLQPGDRVWIHPELPESQSVHYLLIVAFLRGSTNPPPEDWFIKAETWKKEVREEGLVVTVPQGAQQVLLFLAPETGGDFGSVRSAVRGKPGIFVRAAHDLNQASLDRSRLDKYLRDVRDASEADPQVLHDRSVLLARTLNIKLDQECFDKPTQQQAPCLMQNTEQLVLNDGGTDSMVATLTSKPSTDLIGAISATPLAGGGSYSPYVGAVVDLARIFGNLHSAEYQYIPALALPKKQQLNLRLNNAPSFRKPKSVLVIGLPPVEMAPAPWLRRVNPEQNFCLQKSLILPVEGAPLVFSTDIAHDVVLRLQNKSGSTMDLPATAEAARGGFLVDTSALQGKMDAELTGTLRGYWGFDNFAGPTFRLRTAHPAKWIVPAADQSALIVGREDTLRLQSENAGCVEQITLQDDKGKERKLSWKLRKGDELEVQVPLKDQPAGALKMMVKQFGLPKPDEIELRSYSEAARLERFSINAGDQAGVLQGTRLDEVATFELSGVHFVPTKLTRVDQKDELRLEAQGADSAAGLQADQKLVAHATLQDGRVLDLHTTIASPRPKVTLVSKVVQLGANTPAASPVRLGTQDALPQDGRLSFILKTEIPDKFSRNEKIEVSGAEDSFSASLSFADGALLLQDSQTLLAVLDPLKTFGPSAFGALRFRAVGADGTKGDWQPLANLVRIPSLNELRCPKSFDQPCTLTGANLFLIDSIASDSQFSNAVSVPVGFLDSAVKVPRPTDKILYVKFRDDSSTVNTLTLPILPEQR